MSLIAYPNGDANVIVPATYSIAVATQAQAEIYQNVGFPQYPPALNLLGTFQDLVITVFGPFANGAEIVIQPAATEVLYNVGVSPTIPELTGVRQSVVATAVDVTGSISAAAILGGIVTSAAAAVTGTLPTGAVMAAATQLAVGDGVEWAVIKVGANNFTVSAAANHTIVGDAVVVTATSGRFLTVQSSAGVFVTYRVS